MGQVWAARGGGQGSLCSQHLSAEKLTAEPRPHLPTTVLLHTSPKETPASTGGESGQERGRPASPGPCPATRLHAPTEVTTVAAPRSRRAARLAGRTGWEAAHAHPLGLHKHRSCWQRGSPSPHTKLPVRKVHGHPSESGPPGHRAGDPGGRRSAFGLHRAH